MPRVDVFVLDGDPDASKRKWDQIIEDFQELGWTGRSWDPSEPPRGSVVVCHLLGPDEKQAVDQIAKNGTWLVFVSQSTSRPSSPGDNTYQRGAGVRRSTDDTFRRSFARFREALERDGRPTWALLEPDARRVPENILACYVCALGGVPALDAWKVGFEDEVNYWVTAEGIGVKLEWKEDRNKEERLRTFLAATRTLLEGSVHEESRDRG